MATSSAYGSSWAKDWISNLHHSCGNARPFNPLHWAGDRTCASTATRATAVRFLTHCARVRTALSLSLFSTIISKTENLSIILSHNQISRHCSTFSDFFQELNWSCLPVDFLERGSTGLCFCICAWFKCLNLQVPFFHPLCKFFVRGKRVV